MKLEKQEYKKYPFPVRILISYILISIIGIFLLNSLSTYLIQSGSVEGILETILSIGLIVLAYIVIMAISAFILSRLCGKKIYRGIGLYRTTLIIAIFSPIFFIATIVVFNKVGINYTFFNFITLLFEFAVFPIMTFFLRIFTRLCVSCGVINSFKINETKVDNLGSEHKYHTETTWAGDYDGHSWFVDEEIYDGLFEKKRTTTRYCCSVCGRIKYETTESETKVG